LECFEWFLGLFIWFEWVKMVFETIYMIRMGEFGSDFFAKLLISIFAIVIVYFYYNRTKRLDYLYFFVVGTAIWTFVESFVQLTGVREMSTNYLLGIEIPVLVASLLRGISEGAFVIILAVAISDLLMNRKYRKIGIAVLLIASLLIVLSTSTGALPFKDVGGDVDSRRDLFYLPGVVFMVGATLFDLVWLRWFADKEARKRALYCILVMIVVAGIWTAAQFFFNNRWVEVGANGVFERAPPLIEFFSLSYDVVIEIAMMYLPFIAIPYIFGWIRPLNKNKKIFYKRAK
jgi:hypothetical protein